MTKSAKMKVQLMSDLHLEFHRWVKRPDESLICDFIDALDPSGVQVLVLAGDICTMKMFDYVAERFCELYPHVVFVPGNHEYYGKNTGDVEAALDEVNEKYENFYVLNPGKVTIDGVTFVGATLWFEKPKEDMVLQHGRWAMGDYRVIGDFEPWVYEKNRKDQEFIIKHIDEADVIVTHHLPSYKSVASFFEGSILNAFFVCEMDVVIHAHSPPLWVHGHTHRSRNYTIGEKETIIRCNPRGYPGRDKNPEFDRKLILEVEPRKSAEGSDGGSV